MGVTKGVENVCYENKLVDEKQTRASVNNNNIYPGNLFAFKNRATTHDGLGNDTSSASHSQCGLYFRRSEYKPQQHILQYSFCAHFQPTQMLKTWTDEFLSLVLRVNPKFIALHCQEVGGKKYEDSMKHVKDFVTLLMSSKELLSFDKVRIYLDEDYSSAENFTVNNPPDLCC